MDGERLLQLRMRAGLTQAELAHKAGVNPMQPSRIETRLVKDPNLSTLQAMARALDGVGGFQVTLNDLLAPVDPDLWDELGEHDRAIKARAAKAAHA